MAKKGEKNWVTRMHQMKIFYIFVPNLKKLSLSSQKTALLAKLRPV